MIRITLSAALLALAATGGALAATASDGSSQTNGSIAVQALVPVPSQAAPMLEYPSEPGPYTVIYREWSDLAG